MAGSTRRVRSQSLGVSWSDQTAADASGDVSMPQQAQAQVTWQPDASSEVRRPLELRYLTTPVSPIPLAENSLWARTQTEWPAMVRAHLDLEHAAAVRTLLAENLAAFNCCVPTGVQQWNYEAQDCFDGRAGMARTEGNMAEASCSWICAGNPEVALYALEDFFPADPE
eukprot:1455256-Amphidinium_carterae.1